MAENPRIEELRRRVQADPASIAFAALAEEFRRIGNYAEAVETCRTGLQRHPAYLSARVTLGRALIETADYDGAREELETVLRSAPENLAALRGLDQIRERLGHSAVMDPHLAEMMETMHAESLRVAAPPDPDPSSVPLSQPSETEALLRGDIDAAPESQFEPVAPEPAVEWSFTPVPVQPDAAEPAAFAADPLDDPLAATAGGELSHEPQDDHPPSLDGPVDVFARFAPAAAAKPAHDFSFDLTTPFTVLPEPERQALPAVDVSFAAPPLEPVSASADEDSVALFADDAQGAIVVEDDTESFHAPVNPAMLATLARLERFLDAIHSLRS
ncbi:MAG: tetratricopeptide repeat protein [Vicinamibacterales bacterium]